MFWKWISLPCGIVPVAFTEENQFHRNNLDKPQSPTLTRIRLSVPLSQNYHYAVLEVKDSIRALVC